MKSWKPDEDVALRAGSQELRQKEVVVSMETTYGDCETCGSYVRYSLAVKGSGLDIEFTSDTHLSGNPAIQEPEVAVAEVLKALGYAVTIQDDTQE